MDVEERKQTTSTITRELFMRMFDDPFVMAFMTFYEVEPEEVEDKVDEILEYLEKKTEAAEG
ncbi:unnamed protein product [marine sediment metagenome]|uniref:Uncharacterized protein n=1 Tax=marine sediment metagenome TaxID=412755 RepID=X1FS04_9ZZZZ